MSDHDLKLDIKEEKLMGSPSSVPIAQEKVRGKLAMGLLLLFAVALCVSLTYAVFGDVTEQKSDLIKYLFSGLVGMMGVVIGFYYGQNSVPR